MLVYKPPVVHLFWSFFQVGELTIEFRGQLVGVLQPNEQPHKVFHPTWNNFPTIFFFCIQKVFIQLKIIFCKQNRFAPYIPPLTQIWGALCRGVCQFRFTFLQKKQTKLKYIFLHQFYFSGNAFGNSGEDYFWCPTATSWDYCSPKATSTIRVFSKVRVDKSFKVFHVPLTLIVCFFRAVIYAVESVTRWEGIMNFVKQNGSVG